MDSNAFQLPTDAAEFLRSGQQLVYDFQATEFGEVKLQELEKLKAGIVWIGTDMPGDPHADEDGFYTIPAVSLLTGRRGAKLGYKSNNVRLALGMRGHYEPIHCGASCAPASIAWIQKGVRYEIQAKALGGRAGFVKAANSAIRAGNRG